MKDLKKMVSKLRTRLILVSLAEGIIPLLLGFAIFMIVDRVLVLPGLIRVLWIAGVLLWTIIFFVWNILRIPNRSDLAWRLERIYPQLEGRLSTVIDYDNTKGELGYSMALLDKTEQDALSIINSLDLSRVFKKRFFVGLAGLLILVLFISIGWERNSFLRFINPRTAFFSVGLDVNPDKVEIGGHADVKVRVDGVSPMWVWLFSKDSKRRLKRDSDSSNCFHHRLENLRESIQIYASVADVRTEDRRIDVLIPPILRDWTFQYTYPPYSGFPAYTQRRGDIYGLAGTSVIFRGVSNVDLERAIFINQDGDSSFIPVSGKDFETQIKITKQDTFNLYLEGSSGLFSDGDEVIINLFPDDYPEIEILYPAQYVDVPRDMEIEILYKTADDFGVTYATLTSVFRGERSSKGIADFKPAALDTFGTFSWDFSDIVILPGDTLRYFITVYDNDTFNGPKATMSPVYSIRFPLLDELYDEFTSESDKVTGNVESLLERLEDLEKRLEKITESGEITARDREAIEKVLYEHEELENEFADISRKTQDLISKMENTIFLDEESMEKMREIEELMREVETEEVKKAREELMDALKENPQMLEEAMRNFNITEQEFQKRLENTLDFLKRLKNSHRLSEILEKLDDLKNKQDEVKEALQAGAKPEELASDEGILNQEMSRLSEALEELSHEMRQMSKELQNAGGQTGDIAKKMMDVQMSMQMGNSPTSDMEEISEEISSLSQDLQSLRDMMMGGFTAQLKEELRRNQLATINLSGEQEEILKEKISPVFATREKALLNGVYLLRDNVLRMLSALPTTDGGTVSILESATSEAKKAVEKADKGDMYRAKEAGKAAMGLLNSVAFELFALEDAMKGMAGAMPSLAQFFQNLANMAQSQMGLNQLARSLFPMSIGESGISQELMELARSQSDIAKRLREIAQGSEGRVLGDLEGIAGEMESVAADIEKYGLSEEILKRQEKLLKYLLTAQKSLYKERESVRRISKPGKEFPDLASPDGLRLETKRGVSQRDVLEALKRHYPKEYDRLIKAYFRALSIE